MEKERWQRSVIAQDTPMQLVDSAASGSLVQTVDILCNNGR